MALTQAPLAAEAASLISGAASVTGLLGTATTHHLASGGGAWRMDLALDCCAALDVPEAEAAGLAAACELVHQASIVHDDAQDREPMRRSRQSVFARFGAPVAVCVGDHLLASAFAVLSDQPGTLGLVGLFAARVSEMVTGQAGEFAIRLWPAMTIEHYWSLTAGKAGAPIALLVEGAAILAELSEEEVAVAGKSGRTLGVAYQADDDVADLTADLRHGALNGAIAHALQTGSMLERTRLLTLLDRARESGLMNDEADIEARRLAPHAQFVAHCACAMLDGVADDVRSHRLGPVLTASAAALASRLQPSAMARHRAT